MLALKRPPLRPTLAREYVVQGMTCGHCVRSVREKVSAVRGVKSVDVDLASGRLGVLGERYSDEAVRTAVAEAGYWVMS